MVLVGSGNLAQGADQREMTFIPESAGVRAAIPADSKADDFFQTEAYTRWELPWEWAWGEDWQLRTWGDISLGYLTDGAKDGLVGGLGPVFTIERKGVPVVFECGSNPTALSRYRFELGDFGQWFQFTSHGGFRWHINDRLSLAYRFQHMSNAGLSAKNPGLDLHALTLGWRF